MQRVVSVWTRWGDYVLGVRDVRTGESLSVGGRLLVRLRGDTASVCADPGAGERELAVGETVTVTMGELDYTLCCSQPPGAATFAPSRRPWALLDAAAVGLLLAASVWSAAPAPHVLRSGIGALAELGPFAVPGLAENQPSPEGVFAVVAERKSEALRLPGDMRCGRAEMGGDIAGGDGRYGVLGPPDNADPHLARPVPGRGEHTLDGLFVDPLWDPRPLQALPGSSSPTAPFGRETAEASDPANALGSMWGDQLGDALGEGGLGRAGRPGGVVKRFDVAPIDDSGAAQLRVVHTGLRVTGARKASEIGRVMAASFGNFRTCGEAVAPAVLHDVDLAFDVDSAGHVVASGAGADALEQCLEQSVAGVAFAAGADAESHVVYPLHFVAANAKLEGPPVVQPTGAPPCDCGG